MLLIASIGAMATVFGALLTVAYMAWFERLDVVAYPPSALAVFRGFGPFRSDHLVLPIDPVNRGGTSVVLQNVRVELHRTGAEDEPLAFLLGGELESLFGGDDAAFGRFRLTQSIVLEGRTASTRLLVLRVPDWWDRDDDPFRFVGETCYRGP